MTSSSSVEILSRSITKPSEMFSKRSERTSSTSKPKSANSTRSKRNTSELSLEEDKFGWTLSRLLASKNGQHRNPNETFNHSSDFATSIDASFESMLM